MSDALVPLLFDSKVTLETPNIPSFAVLVVLEPNSDGTIWAMRYAQAQSYPE
jgi:hypothetical protein